MAIAEKVWYHKLIILPSAYTGGTEKEDNLMRKHLSRVMAALLVLAMALTMLPVVSAAKERFTATPIDGIPESGQTFVIYSAPRTAEARRGRVSFFMGATSENVY